MVNFLYDHVSLVLVCIYEYWGAEGTSMDVDCDMIFSANDDAGSAFGCCVDIGDIDKHGLTDIIISSQGPDSAQR